VDPDTGPQMVRVRVGVRTRPGVVQVEVRVPAGDCHPEDLLPALRAIDDALVADACRASAAAGRQVSCRAGCGACCRHLVAVTPFEAASLVRLVGVLPAARRRVARSRFTAAADAFTEAGLHDELAQVPLVGRTALRELAARYFRLGIPCPFLESEHCTIYPYRPLVCREYVVTSPPGNCRMLRQIERVSVPGRLFARLAQRRGDGPAWLPHVLALEWVAGHPAAGHQGRERKGPALLTELLGANRIYPVAG
jgi:Fe-S-cluster containining protein